MTEEKEFKEKLQIFRYWCCCLLIPFLLQTIGFFTPMWASSSTCHFIGLWYSCCTASDNITSCGYTNGGNELDAPLFLEVFSLVLMFLAVVCLSCGAVCSYSIYDKPWWFLKLGVCSFVMYPVAGLLSVVGCIAAAIHFSTSELGYSFALCLTAGCLILLLTIPECYKFCTNSHKVAPNQDATANSALDVLYARTRRIYLLNLQQMA